MAKSDTTFGIRPDSSSSLEKTPRRHRFDSSDSNMNLRTIPVLFLVFVLTTALTSCSSSSSNSTHLLYVSTGQGIYAYRITTKSGSSVSVFTTPFIAGNGPTGLVINPAGNLLYVANQGDNTISMFKIDPVTATLTE